MGSEGIENVYEAQQAGCETRDIENVKLKNPALANDRDDNGREIPKSKDDETGNPGGIDCALFQEIWLSGGRED